MRETKSLPGITQPRSFGVVGASCIDIRADDAQSLPPHWSRCWRPMSLLCCWPISSSTTVSTTNDNNNPVTPGHGSPSIRRHALSAVTETFFSFLSGVFMPDTAALDPFLFIRLLCVLFLSRRATRVERHHTTRRMNEEDGWNLWCLLSAMTWIK